MVIRSTSTMLWELPNEEVLIRVGDVDYVIPAGWVGVHDIVSVCGWWMGLIKIEEIQNVRYLLWLETCTPKFDDE